MRDVCLVSWLVRLILMVATVGGAPGPVAAQAPNHQHEPSEAPPIAWAWTRDASVFFGYNHQQRRFADATAWESQNWAMLGARRQVGRGTLGVEGMLSFEPFTIAALGSPQLFQTGESYQDTPLVNYQHPHDLLMALGATYRVERPRGAYWFGAALVGSPALGPTPFMHRESARNNPQAPLSHHSMDSTHMAPGVLTVGLASGPVTVEASAFRGQEPDEDRLNVERPALNSWSARIGWRRGPWQAQFSGGRIHEPEWFDPYDHTRLTASIAFSGAVVGRPLSALVAWGENRVNNGFENVDDSYLAEWDIRATRPLAIYGRTERAMKQILGLGFHPRGFTHPHFYSRITAFTFGGVHHLPVRAVTTLGIGADVTVYRTSSEMAEFYEGSHSYHVFLRWRPAVSTAHVH